MLKDLAKEYQKSAAGLVDKMYGLADNLDAKGVGTKKWFPDKETREVLKLSLYTFFLYIATADRGISQEETDFINEVLSSEYTTADYKLLADRSKVNGDEYANEVPVIFRAGVETIGQVLDYLDAGKKLEEIENISEKNAAEVVAGLKSLGWDQPA